MISIQADLSEVAAELKVVKAEFRRAIMDIILGYYGVTRETAEIVSDVIWGIPLGIVAVGLTILLFSM